MAPKKGSTEKPPVDVCVVILGGLPGSGKSTLRERLVKNGWVYVSQDEMGSSDACEKALVKALKNQKSCVVDRCNVTSSERRLWMQYANRAVDKKEAKGVKLHFEAVWMATSPEVCKDRVKSRQGHETLSAENADAVVDEFCKGMRVPERTGQEPYECVQFVATADDADLVVQRYADPTHIDSSVKASSSASSSVVAAPRQAPFTARAAGTEVLILRHGERADRAKDRDGGWVDDPPLTPDGRETAKRAGQALRSLPAAPWAAVYCSPYFRCLQTANEAAAELGLPVRIEPGLSELTIAKIFNEAPSLRPSADSLQGALTRTEVDLSCAPHRETLPQWPEEMRAANSRVLETVQAIIARHPGQAILLVCHSHSLVELTRHLPKSGGGATSSNAGYCALSHISPGGELLRCVDLSYLKLAEAAAGHRADALAPSADVGHWQSDWRWSTADCDTDPFDGAVEMLLEMGLDGALERYPAFRTIFHRGTQEQQTMWREGWACRSDEVRSKLLKANAANVFRSDSFAPPCRTTPAEPQNLFPGPDNLGTEKHDDTFEDIFLKANSSLAFPSTAHLKNLGAATRDDKLCDATRQRSFCGGTRRVSVEEKIDGANVGISLDSQHRFRLQARSKMITWNSDPQFAGLEQWLDQHRSTLCELLERNNDILFGEWCAYVHTVKYTGLPGYFLAFDIYDKRKDAFLSRKSFHTRLQRATGSKIPVVPMVCPPRTFASMDEVVDLLKTQSRFGEGFLEGVYLRVDSEVADSVSGETYLVDRCKLVRSEFQQAIIDVNKHGFSGNGKNGLCMDLAFSYTEHCYPCAESSRVEPEALHTVAEAAKIAAEFAPQAQGKYPSTPHLPFSPGVNSDDILLADCTDLIREEVVVTEKFDGGNCCIKGGQVFARTHSQPATHESFSAVKQLSLGFAALLGDIELFGENMQGVHSIEYKNLSSFFYVFAARADGKWFAWDDVVALAESLELPTVPVVFRGPFSSAAQLQKCMETWAQERSAIGEDVQPEGFVLRRVHAFAIASFAENMAKYVRANHVQTDPDWKRRWKKAQIGSALPSRAEFKVSTEEESTAPRGAEADQSSSASCSQSPSDGNSGGAPSLQRQESRPLPRAFSLWLNTAILEELSPGEAEAIVDCVVVILQGAADDPDALENAAEVLKDSGAPLCAEALPRRWQAEGAQVCAS